MGVESAADRLAMLSSDDFGTAATVGSATVYGIFDDDYKAVNLQTGEIVQTGPQFTCREADVTGLAVRGTVVISGTTYYVLEKRSDGTGMTELLLSRN
jgi:hypothetical protein